MDIKRILYTNITFNSHPKYNNINCNNDNNNKSNGTSCISTSGTNNHFKNSNNSCATNSSTTTTTTTNGTSNNNSNGLHDEFQLPKHPLCDPKMVKLDWSQAEKIGGGLINVGNTCFLNSVLQCLTYCPPLYNFLVKFNGGHSQNCKLNQFCMLCEMEKHVKRIKSTNGGAMKPMSIVQRLKYINRSFQFGRQEDAHEFLRFVIDHMWKACLMNLDISVKSSSANINGNGNTNGSLANRKLDPRVKETTFINHIFGGYHRSQVLCLSCNTRSNTYDYFMDLMLDIRNAKSLEEALKKFTQPETLENENAYKCNKCRKMVKAKKKFTVYKAPNVATFQFKRFDSDRIFGGKITKFISYPDELDFRPYMSDPNSESVSTRYHLSAVLVHVGHSSNSGHYFCFIKNSNNFWYRMDDSSVSLVTQNTVLQQQAYVLFYTRKTPSSDMRCPSNGITKTSNAADSFPTSSANMVKTEKPSFANDPAPKANTATNNNYSNLNNQNKPNNHNSFNGHSNLSNKQNNNSLNGLNKHNSSLNGFSKHNNSFNGINKHNNCLNGLNKQSASLNGINKIGKQDHQNHKSGLSTWFGSRSNLAAPQRRQNLSARDRFNEELDRGKKKKMKFR